MKKRTATIMLLVLCCLNGCKQRSDVSAIPSIITNESLGSGLITSVEENNEEEIEKVNENNRRMIVEALGIDESSRNIRFILRSLNTIGTGELQKAEVSEGNGEIVIKILAQNKINYCVYLSESGNVDAIQNTDNGEWVICSER